jgi:hypothetical protein
MVLLDPEILEAGRDLSPAVTGAGVAIGLFIWLFGVSMHRFWIVTALTLGAGVYGLLYGPEHGMQPIVAGLLLAVSAGTLGLALMRVLAFVTGGWAFYLVARAVVPGSDEPLLCILVGGLFSVLLFRLWITAVSSMAGTVVITYSSLWLIAKLTQANAAAWASNNPPLWNWGLGSVVVVGILVQFIVNRHYVKRKKANEEKAAKAEKERQEAEIRRQLQPPSPPPKGGWWPFGGKGKAA